MEFNLDRKGSTPLYQQIKTHLDGMIRRGQLPGGTRLPPSRALAEKLGVTRLTVVSAYSELEAAGLVASHVGRGTFVVGAPATGRGEPAGVLDDSRGADSLGFYAEPSEAAGGAEARETAAPAWLPWQKSTVRGEISGGMPAREMLKLARREGVISFATGAPAADFLPVADLQKAINAVLKRDGAAALQYDMPEGYPPLRETISRYLAGLEIQAPAERILITSGTQQAIDLVARVLAAPGEHVITESPTYSGAIDAFEARGARILGIPVDSAGMRVEMAESTILQRPASLIYCAPTFQNPTGSNLAPERRRHLLSLAERYGVPIVEDDAYSELRYSGPALPALAAQDRRGHVIHVGSFSKMLVPGLRIGYMVIPPAAYDRFVVMKQTADLHTSSLVQRTVHEYLRTRNFAAHLKKVRGECRKRRDAMVAAMKRYFPGEAIWSTPDGGPYLWVTLPSQVSAVELYLEGIKQGVAFAVGSSFFPDRADHNCFRLNFSLHPPEVIEEGIKRLGRAFELKLSEGRGIPTRRGLDSGVPIV